MKKTFLILSLLFSVALLQAQTQKNLKLTTANHKLFDYGQTATLTTTDSAVNVIDSIIIADDEAGIIEVQTVGFNDSLGLAVTGSKIMRYVKTAGTLTLGSATNTLASSTDAGLGTATWSVAASDDNIIVTVKGKLNYEVLWRANTRKIFQKP